jgi:hypothetical protein
MSFFASMARIPSSKRPSFSIRALTSRYGFMLLTTICSTASGTEVTSTRSFVEAPGAPFVEASTIKSPPSVEYCSH